MWKTACLFLAHNGDSLVAGSNEHEICCVWQHFTAATWFVVLNNKNSQITALETAIFQKRKLGAITEEESWACASKVLLREVASSGHLASLPLVFKYNRV